MTATLDTPKLSSLMAYLETGEFNRNIHLVPYQESDLSPFSIGHQTALLLENINHGLLVGQSASSYFHNVTIAAYLDRARVGSEVPFSRDTFQAENIDPEDQLAARHAFVIFAWIPETVTWRFVPTGFSRRGMLAAPSTPQDYLKRINRLTSYLEVVSVKDKRKPGKPLPTTLTIEALAFFKTAGILQMDKLPSKEREQFESILGNMQIDL